MRFAAVADAALVRTKTLFIAAVLAAAPLVALGPAAQAADGPAVRINEVESSGGTPGDWVELVNTGTAPVDLSGWVVRDNDDTHVYTIAAGTTLGAGAFLPVDVESAFGLGAADSARLYLPDGATLVDSYSWTAHAATTYGRCPDGTGEFRATTSSTRGAANDCREPGAATVRINEVESNGGTPGDWIELTNTGAGVVDLSGWVLKDNDDTHVFTIAAGTTLAGGGFVALDVDPVFGLGGADSARLFTAGGALVDSYSWTAHAATTYGRCPDGTGDFATTTAATKGTANACPGQTPALPWPGGSAVTTADAANVLGGNISGLFYDRGALWAVKNGPGTLYRLSWDGTQWSPAATYTLHYPGGTGDPDAEGVTLANGAIYLSTERDNANSGVSRPAVERFDPATGAITSEWNLTADLPPVAANSGLEGITFVPDSYLTAKGFRDEHTGAAYDPATYPNHGGGLFLVGLEANGSIYAYALSGDGSYTRVATIASGFVSVMDLQYEPETGPIWAACDDTCGGRTATLDVDTSGKLAVTKVYERPAGMPNYNNEGFAVAPQSECVAGQKRVWWSDDTNDEGHALRAGTIACTVPDPDADDDGVYDAVDPHPGTAGDDFTGGRILDRAGRTVTVEPGLTFTVGAGAAPLQVHFDGRAATIALGAGVYSVGADRVATLSGEPAVVTVAVKSQPILLTVAAGGSVTYDDALTGIASTGPVQVRAASQPAGACAGIAVQNVVVGGTGNERLAGTGGNDLILGRGGNDVVEGNGGTDCITTGPGNDTITTADGNDWIDAGGGNNVVNAGGGDNTVHTESGNDTIATGAGNDTVDAGNGNNNVSTGAGADAVTAGSGNDTLDCGAGTDAAHPGRGNNTNSGARCESFTG